MKLADVQEFEAVAKVLKTYCIEGGAANVEALKAHVFHEKAVMNGSGKDG